jgi:wobble nucleotide-excising tRNase
MNLEEIQNDYQSFWQIIKDVNQPPALIANCMRHIIEYFFGFIEKIKLKDVLEVLEKKDLNINKYKAFLDIWIENRILMGLIEEFKHGCFKETFKLVFEKSGYINHYLLYND